MNRRHLLAGSAVAGLGALPLGVTRAQEQEGGELATTSLLDLTGLEGFVGSAVREFYLAARTLGDLVADEPLAAIVATVELENEEIAAAAIDTLRDIVPDALESELGVPSTGTRRSSVGSLGDDNLGLTLTYDYPAGRANELSIGIAIVHKGTQAQVVIVATFEDGLNAATALAEALDDRWPDPDLLATLPTAEDLPMRVALRSEAVAP